MSVHTVRMRMLHLWSIFYLIRSTAADNSPGSRNAEFLHDTDEPLAASSNGDTTCALQLQRGYVGLKNASAGPDGEDEEDEDLLESTLNFEFGKDEPGSVPAEKVLPQPKMKQDLQECRPFGHRGSTHLSYGAPPVGTRYWFSQVRLQKNPLSGIYWANTFTRGYTGVQYNARWKEKIMLLCSIWDDKQNGCTVENKCNKTTNKEGVKAECPGEYNHCDMFGSEGTGVKSSFRHALSPDETFSFTILREPFGQNGMHHQCWVHHPELNHGEWYLMLDYHGPDSKHSGRLTSLGGFNEKFAPMPHEQGLKNEGTYSGWTSADGLTWQKQTTATLDPARWLSGKNGWKIHGAIGTRVMDESTGEEGFSLATCGCKIGHCCPEHVKCPENGLEQIAGNERFSVPRPERMPGTLEQFVSEVVDKNVGGHE